MDDESRNYLIDRLEALVQGGFDDEARVLEDIPEWVEGEVGEPEPVEIEGLQSLARRRFAEQREAELRFPAVTVNDRIDAAFQELDAHGVVALQNAGYTMSEGWELVGEAMEERGSPARGAVFYHGQDLERGVAGLGLMLAFGAFADDPTHEEVSLEIARQARATLEKHGVPTDWNGAIDSRIQILPFEWQRRRRSC